LLLFFENLEVIVKKLIIIFLIFDFWFGGL